MMNIWHSSWFGGKVVNSFTCGSRKMQNPKKKKHFKYSKYQKYLNVVDLNFKCTKEGDCNHILEFGRKWEDMNENLASSSTAPTSSLLFVTTFIISSQFLSPNRLPIRPTLFYSRNIDYVLDLNPQF